MKFNKKERGVGVRRKCKRTEGGGADNGEGVLSEVYEEQT